MEWAALAAETVYDSPSAARPSLTELMASGNDIPKPRICMFAARNSSMPGGPYTSRLRLRFFKDILCSSPSIPMQ